jgi:citronellol/citronellal dehydrogenase
MDGKWFKNNLAYTISKYGMSMCVLGLSEELKKHEIAVNALWPKTSIATAAVRNLLGGEKAIQHSRKPEIVADAAYLIFTQPSRDFTGNFLTDEEILKQYGITNLKKYEIDPETSLISDFFLDDSD